jgi:hypothetical protein
LEDFAKTRRQMDSVVFSCSQLRMPLMHAFGEVSGPSKGNIALSIS